MQAPQIMIIGLGQFGMALTRSLMAHGGEVLAIDRNPSRVEEAAAFAAQAMCFDAADEAELQRVAPARRDYCVCAIGDESRESSIIVTALLRQLGAPRVIARATDSVHERIPHPRRRPRDHQPRTQHRRAHGHPADAPRGAGDAAAGRRPRHHRAERPARLRRAAR
jgi:hypothetical protein